VLTFEFIFEDLRFDDKGR